MYIQRSIEGAILSAATEYPVITLLGPRQSGKSTLAQNLFPTKLYVNLEYPDDRAKIQYDPRGFLASIPAEGVIIDEVQRLPEILSYIQGFVDNDRANGRFILTGSHQLELHQALAQSLAGRTALMKVMPFSLKEIKTTALDYSLNELMYRGGYPTLYRQSMDVRRYYQEYIATYVEKDVRQMIQIKDLSMFQKFLVVLASRVGQLIDYHGISNDLGISANTIKHWCSVLEASFIVFELRPYFDNIGKRLLKSPKIYFYDTGLLCALLGINQVEQLAAHPLRGAIFENFVILDLMKDQYNHWLNPDFYFYRDHSQNEVDLLCKKAMHLVPIEIKSSQTFHLDFLKGIEYLHKTIPQKVVGGYVIYAGSPAPMKQYQLLNYENAGDVIFKE